MGRKVKGLCRSLCPTAEPFSSARLQPGMTGRNGYTLAVAVGRITTCFSFSQKGNFKKPLTLSARHFHLLCSLLLDEIFKAVPRVYVATYLL